MNKERRNLDIEANSRKLAGRLGHPQRSVDFQFLHLDDQGSLLFGGYSDLELDMSIHSNIDVFRHDSHIVRAVHVEHISFPVHPYFLGDVAQSELHMHAIHFFIEAQVRYGRILQYFLDGGAVLAELPVQEV